MTRSQENEHYEHVFGSRYDDTRERYACQIEDARREVLIWQEQQEYYTKVWEAGFGTDWEAYDAYWTRLEEYSTRRYDI